MDEVETTNQSKPVEKTVDAVFGLTIPPAGIKFVGTAIRLDLNGAVIAMKSPMMQQNTCWESSDGKLVSALNIGMRANTAEVLKAEIHKRVDEIFDAWSEQNKIAPGIAGLRIIEPVKDSNPEGQTETETPEEPVKSEQQPASEALDDIASGKTKTIEVESKLNPSGAEVS